MRQKSRNALKVDQHPDAIHSSGGKFRAGDARLAFALHRAEKQIEFEDQQGKPKQIVANGVWVVGYFRLAHYRRVASAA